LTDGRTFTLIRSQNSRTEEFRWILSPALATASGRRYRTEEALRSSK